MTLHRILRHAAFAAFGALALLGSAHAAVIASLNDIQYWVGSGSNQAALVIDWNDGQTTTSYVWGYRWTGSATGEDMLKAIAGAISSAVYPTVPGAATPDGNGDPTLTLYLQSFSFGDGIYQIDYLAHSRGGFDPDSSGYWSYYVANGSSSLPSNWSYSDVGMGSRALSNNSWDGWSWSADFVDSTPNAPISAVPEPAIYALLALGGLALLAWRKRITHAPLA
jgi:hypothetical protein